MDSEAITLSWKELSLPDKLANSEVIIANIQNQEILYTFGGEHSPTQVSKVVRFATLSSSGAPVNWKTTSPLPIALRNHTVTFFRNMVFVIGGKTNLGEVSDTSVYSNRIYCGRLDETGNISWEGYSLLPDDLGWLAFHASVATAEKIYVIGGLQISGNSNDIWSILPGNDCNDSLRWELEGYLDSGISNHSATVVTLESGEQFIYVVGGYQGSNLSNSIQSAQVESDGSLGEWSTVSILNDVSGLQRHESIATGGFLYVIGGSSSFTLTNALDNIYRTRIEENGALGSWEQLNNLPIQIHSHAVTVSESGQIYIVGGDASKDLFYQEILYTPLFGFSKLSEPMEEVSVGDEIEYTIHYTNNGLRPLTNVIITDEIPANTFLIRPEYELDTRILTWTVPFLDLNQTGFTTFTVQVMPPVTAVPPEVSTPTVPSLDSGLTCSSSWPSDGGTPRPACTPTSTPMPQPTTPVPPTIPPPDSTRYFDLTPIPIINQAWMCEEERCIQSNVVMNTPHHLYLPLIAR